MDPRVGLVFHKKLGSKVQTGEPIVTVTLAENFQGVEGLEKTFQDAISIGSSRKPVPKLIFEVLS